MKLGFRGKLFFVSITIILFGGLCAAVFLEIVLKDLLLSHLAHPHIALDEEIWKLRNLIFIGMLVGIVVSIFMSGFASHLTSRSIKVLLSHAKRIAEQKETKKIHIDSEDEIGSLAGTFNTLIEELEKTLTALAYEKNKFEMIFDSSPFGIIVLDESKNIIMSNKAVVSLLSLAQSPEGKTLLEIIRDPGLNQKIENLEKNSQYHLEIHHPKYKNILVQITHQSSLGTILFFRDTTENRKLETIRKDFVANVSHELRTPVSIIRANSETLMSGGLADKEYSQTSLEGIFRNAVRMSSIIEDLLEISKIEAGKYPIVKKNIQLLPLINRALDSLHGCVEKRITRQCSVNDTFSLFADEKALERILTNLLDNVVKFSPFDGIITITADEKDGKSLIRIADNGHGISKIHSERIFERFYRVDVGRSRDQGGTGLGLSIVKNLTELMGGSVHHEPNIPQGSVFVISLPNK